MKHAEIFWDGDTKATIGGRTQNFGDGGGTGLHLGVSKMSKVFKWLSSFTVICIKEWVKETWSFKVKFIFYPSWVWPLKSDQAIKKSKFNFVLEYPTWVSIKRTLTDKLASDGQNLISSIQFQENVQQPENALLPMVLGFFL